MSSYCIIYYDKEHDCSSQEDLSSVENLLMDL